LIKDHNLNEIFASENISILHKIHNEFTINNGCRIMQDIVSYFTKIKPSFDWKDIGS
jgi:hypothetical protein